MIGAIGRGAAFTGASCVEWCGHQVHDDFSVAGNMLAGPDVLDATAARSSLGHRPAARRAPDRGDDCGRSGRRRQARQAGRGAAAAWHEDYPSLDLRVDDHVEPIVELRRLYAKSLERFQPFVACLAGRDDPVGLLQRDEIEARIAAFTDARGNVAGE